MLPHIFDNLTLRIKFFNEHDLSTFRYNVMTFVIITLENWHETKRRCVHEQTHEYLCELFCK